MFLLVLCVLKLSHICKYPILISYAYNFKGILLYYVASVARGMWQECKKTEQWHKHLLQIIVLILSICQLMVSELTSIDIYCIRGFALQFYKFFLSYFA